MHDRKGFQDTLVWATDSLPPVLTDNDPASWEIGTTISKGSVFRIIQYDPGLAECWHATDPIDYAIILSGEIDTQLDEGEVYLLAGDVLVQRRTIDTWVTVEMPLASSDLS